MATFLILKMNLLPQNKKFGKKADFAFLTEKIFLIINVLLD